MSASVVFGSLLIALVYLRCVATDKAELERLRKAYEARVAAQTEDIIYSFEFNKSAEIRATRKPYYDKADYTYEEMDQFTNVPASFEPKVSEPYNRYQLWRIFNWYDKDKNNLTDNPYAKKYNKVIDRVKWFYRNLVHKVEAQGRVHEDTRYDRIWNRSRFIKHELHKVERLKQRLLWYGTPRTTSELSILHRYLLQQTDPGDKGAYTESVSPWFKIHPPYTIPDGRPMYFTWFDGSPEQRIPYANPDWVHFDPRSEGLDSGPVNWTARSMDPLPWHERKILGGYTNKYLWPPRTTPTDFWRPSRKTTVEVVEGSEYIYVYNEDNPRTTQDKGLDSSMRDRMDSAGYEWWKSEEAKVKRKRFEEERAELLAENNLTDSHSPEKRVLAALRAEVDPSRIKEGMHSAADREIQKFARHFVGCFAPTRRIWLNEELTLRPRFVANSSRRTLNMFDELYPTVVRSDEINLHYYITTASPSTHLSLETLYDGLDTSEEVEATPTTDETGSARSPKAEATSKADRLPPRSKASKAVDALLGKLTTLVRARGKAKKVEDAEKGERKDDEKNRRGRSKKSEAVAGKLKAKSPSKESKAAAQSKQAVKRSRRHVARRGVDMEDPEQLDAEPDMPSGVNDGGQRSEDLDSEEIVKERMDEEDKRIFAAVEARMACKFGNNGSVRAREVVRQDVTPMKKRKPTYHYTSKDVEEAERHWNEVQKKKAEKAGGGKGKKNKRRQRSAGQYEAELDPLNQKFAKDGRTIITMENSTPSYEYFQKKVYPSQNLTSAQLNDEDFVRNLIPKLEEENKMLMQELRMRATEQAMEVKAAQKDMIRDMSEVHDDKSFEMGLQSIETTAAMTTVKRKRRATSEELDALDLKRIDEYGALDVKRRKKRFMNQEESEELDASDLKRIDAINAKLKAEGYDREAILKELNATKNKDGELEVKRRKKRFMNQEESEELDASDLKRIDLINAKLKAEGYDREAILKELNATKNKDGELEVKRKKRSIDTKKHDIREDEILNAQINRESLRQKREVNETGGDKQAKLKRNLEVYSLIDQWKEQQVELAMCSSKERRLLNEIDKLRKEMNISHGEDDPYYKAAVTEAIRRENETALKYAKEINAWWSKEQKERRAWEAELIKKHNMPNQRDNEKFDEDEEKIKQEQLKLLQQVHEKEMAERKAKGLPPDSYEKMLPVAKKEMEEEQKKYEEECRCRPKTVDELMKEFDGSVDIDKLRRNLEVYDLIDKWKKRQEKIEAEKEKKEKQRRRRAVIETGDKLTRVKRKTGKDSDGEYVEDMSRYNEGKRIYKEIHHKMKGYTDQADDSKPVDDVVKGFMDNQKKYDHADYRKKRDLRCHADKKVNHKANVDYFQVEDFNIKRHGNTSIYEYVYSDTYETEPKQEKTWHEKCENVAERLGIYGLKVEENHKESKNAISPDQINKYHENIEQRKLKKVMLRKRRDADALNISNIDIDHKVLSSELNRMISEHAEKQKLYPRTTKKRPTASSEYPLKDDFQPFIKSSKELRDFEEKEQMRERFALFKTFNDLMETTKDDSGEYLDVFKTTTTTKSAKEKSKDKIQNLRSFIKTKLDDTVKKFSEALILLNATGTTVAATTEHSAQPTTFRKKYEHNPDDLLHATDVTFDFAANAGVQTTTQEVETFSPWYTHVQVYNKYNFSEAADGETTVVVFPPSRPEDYTCSPLYHFHRYYHELNTSVDLRTVEETTYAFMTKDATDSFTLPSYAPLETVYKYPNRFDENATEPHEVTTSLFDNSDFKVSEEGKTETVIVTPLLDTKELANMALTDDDPEVNKDISDIRKFHPPNLNEIKQYIDSVTRSREKFCRDNFEWDSENSAYTMVREEATKTVCPKLHQKDREFIEALEKEGLRPSTKGKVQEFIEGQENKGLGLSTKCTLQTMKITRDEEKNIYDRYNLEEPYKMSKYDSVSQPEISPDGSIPDLKTYVKALLKKYSNEATNEPLDSAQRRKKHLLKQKLKDLLATAKDSKEPGKSSGSDSKNKHKKAEQREIDLKTQLLNVLHKYSEEILKTNVITNNRTKKKYRNMKNVVRLVVENYSPGPEMDIVGPPLSLEETSQEEAEERKKATGPTDEPHVDLKRQLDKILSHSHALNPHDKTLKLMVQKALRVSCENIDSDNISFEPVFNKTRIEDLPDYVTNDVVTDRQFKTHFRLKLKNLMNQFSREVLGGKENLTSQERRVNGHMLQVLRAAVNAFTFGPETDNLAHVFKKIPDDSTEPTRAKPKFDEKKDLRVQVEKFIQTYKETGHEDTFEKDTDKRLRTMVADLMEDNSFEYSHTAEMEGRVKRLTRAETITETTHTTTLNSEEQAEVEQERRRRTPTYDYYDTNEEVAKYRPPGEKRLTTIDYWDLYKKKVTEQTSTTLSESQQARRDGYINQVERMGDILDAQVASHERKVLRQSPTTRRTRGTTRDSMETDETSEEEPITYRTQGPVEPRMEYEFSDSREFEIPFYGVTVTKFTARLEDGFYTPGQGFENRSTLAQSDEYARAHRKFRYELANPAFNDPAVPRRLVPLDMLTPPTSTVDYYSFYRERLRKITTSPPEPTRDPVSLERYRKTFIAHVEANDRALWAHLDNAAPTPADAQRTRKVRRRLTTPDSELTEEESEMEPITYFTAGPVDRRVEYEASDSREYYVPILGITLSSLHTRLYTPGEGFENRSTIPPDDEYRRAHWQFKYDPQVEIDRQGLTFSPQPSSTQSSPPTTSPRRPLHKILTRVKEWRLSDKFDALKQRLNEWRLGDRFDSLKEKVNNGSLWNWRGKIETIASAVDKRAHRLMHALYAGAGPKHNCSVEH